MKNKQNLQLPKIKYSLTIIKFAEYLAVIYSAPHFLNFSRNKVPGVVTIIPTPSTPAYDADHPCRISHNLTSEIPTIQKGLCK